MTRRLWYLFSRPMVITMINKLVSDTYHGIVIRNGKKVLQ